MAELKVLLINNLVTSKEDPVPELKLTVTILGILILALQHSYSVIVWTIKMGGKWLVSIARIIFTASAVAFAIF